MGTFIHKFGTMSIPQDKRAAFIEDAKTVADKAGLFSLNYTSVFGKKFHLLSFPTFNVSDDDGYADFNYSYFEDDIWENAGINLKEYIPYSGKVGWLQFNRAVMALYFLAESYSEEPYVSFNDSVNRPKTTINWLEYALNRELSFPYRKNLWTAYELIAEKELEYYGKVESTLDSMLDDISGVEKDSISQLDVSIVTYGIEKLLKDCENNPKEKPKDTLTYDDFMRIYQKAVKEYKDSSDLDEDDQIKFLLGLFTCDDSERNVYKKKDDTSALVLGTIFLTAVTAAKIVSEIYKKDFWELWKTIKGRITITSAFTSPLNKNDDKEVKREVVTTEQFFFRGPGDRLYWWKKDSDVVFGEETERRLRGYAERHKALCGNDLSGDITAWQKRFVTLLAANPRIYCFEQMFYEFIGSFHDVRFKAAVLLLEETAENDDKLRQLLAVFANKELREYFFSF